LKRLKTLNRLARSVARAESWWFDVTRHVRTSGDASVEKLTLLGVPEAGVAYIPARPAGVRALLKDLPIRNPADYKFVDLGSGMSRILFLAAEYAFRRVEGVEFAIELHEQACRNIGEYRHFKQRCSQLRSINADACDYRFPNENLAVFMFNPFGPEVTKKVLANLAASVEKHRRRVVVAML